MNGEFGRDENHCDDMEEEEEEILTHAEHKAQGNELYKSKGMFVLQIVRWPVSAVACWAKERAARAQHRTTSSITFAAWQSWQNLCFWDARGVSCVALVLLMFLLSYDYRIPLLLYPPPRLPRSHCSLHAGN